MTTDYYNMNKIINKMYIKMYAQNRKIGKPNNLKFWEQ